MRNPNGYGTVYKKKEKLRKPWIAVKTFGVNDDGRYIRKTIGTYTTREEAMIALSAYNGNPYDLDKRRFTFAEIYEQMPKGKYTAERKSRYKTAFGLLRMFHTRKFVEIVGIELENVVNDLDCTTQHKTNARMLLSAMYEYAISIGICEKNLAQFKVIDFTPRNRMIKTPFSPDEIMRLWEISDNDDVALLLILIYSGVRISELLNLDAEDVDLGKQFFNIREAKTISGIRQVPIADEVLPLWERIYRPHGLSAFTNEQGYRWTYSAWQKRHFQPLMNTLGMNHTIHETRHTCITLLKTAGIADITIKQIVGHKSEGNITENVYTHIPFPAKLEAINTLHRTVLKYVGKQI